MAKVTVLYEDESTFEYTGSYRKVALWASKIIEDREQNGASIILDEEKELFSKLGFPKKIVIEY